MEAVRPRKKENIIEEEEQLIDLESSDEDEEEEEYNEKEDEEEEEHHQQQKQEVVVVAAPAQVVVVIEKPVEKQIEKSIEKPIETVVTFTPKTIEKNKVKFDFIEDLCNLCFCMITKTNNYTVLSCKHRFHAKCAHEIITGNLNSCPVCKSEEVISVLSKEDRALNGDDGTNKQHNINTVKQSNGDNFFELNWGANNDVDLKITKISYLRDILKRYNDQLQQSNEIVSPQYSSSNNNSNNNNNNNNNNRNNNQIFNPMTTNIYCRLSDFILDLEQYEHLRQDVMLKNMRSDLNATSKQQQQQQQNGYTATTVMSKLFGISLDRKANTDLQMETNPMIFIQKKIKSVDMNRLYNINAKTLIDHKIHISTFFDNGYDILDLIILMATWNNLLFMGLNDSLVWTKYYDKLNVKIIVETYRITIADIFKRICCNDLNRLIQIQFTSQDLRILQADTVILCNYGMNKYNMNAFDFTPEQWKQDLKLDGKVLYYLLKFTPLDLHDNKQQACLKWVNWENRNGPTFNRFVSLFPDYPIDLINNYKC